MLKWIIFVAVIGIPLAVLYMYDFQGNRFESNSDISKSSVIDVGKEFIKQASHEEPIKENMLGMLNEITDADLLKEKEIPDLSASVKIQNNGVRLSTDYNQASFDYSSGKLPSQEYLPKLLDFKIKYEKYMTALDSYVGKEDIVIQRNSIILELKEIEQQITALKNSADFQDGWETQSEYDKYRKLLPSMFNP